MPSQGSVARQIKVVLMQLRALGDATIRGTRT